MMKVCIPIKNAITYELSNDLNKTQNICIFDLEADTKFILSTSDMNLGQIIDYLIINDVDKIISIVSTVHHYKYIDAKNITIYEPAKDLNAIENIKLFKENKITATNYHY